MAILIAYFSRADENYVSGALKSLEIGNTQVVASMIQKFTCGELFHILPAKPYAKDYNTCIAQAQEDQRRNARPELTAWPEHWEDCDTVYLGYPNYWGTMPMAVFTFLEGLDFTGKTILPFCTHEGSGLGRSEEDIRRLCPRAVVKPGLAIVGARAGQSENVLRAWLGSSGKTICTSEQEEPV